MGFDIHMLLFIDINTHIYTLSHDAHKCAHDGTQTYAHTHRNTQQQAWKQSMKLQLAHTVSVHTPELLKGLLWKDKCLGPIPGILYQKSAF